MEKQVLKIIEEMFKTKEMKKQLLEATKEMFRNGDIKIYVENEVDNVEKGVDTIIEIRAGEEKLASEKSTFYLDWWR